MSAVNVCRRTSDSGGLNKPIDDDAVLDILTGSSRTNMYGCTSCHVARLVCGHSRIRFLGRRILLSHTEDGKSSIHGDALSRDIISAFLVGSADQG